MILRVFAVLDSKAEFFAPPFFQPTVAQAVRMMVDVASRGDSMLARHPADFSLYEIALWDDQSGRFDQHAVFQFIGAGTAFVPQVPAPLFDRED